jgi:hypothetical protein
MTTVSFHVENDDRLPMLQLLLPWCMPPT